MTAVLSGPREAQPGVAEPPMPAPRRPKRWRVRKPSLPSRREVSGSWGLVSSACAMVALVSLWLVAQSVFLSALAQSRAQDLLYAEFRQQLAAATAPIGPVTPVGDPVALLTIPRLGLSQVVVEGTASGDTLAGPGHLRKTVLPGQVGTSVIMGRAATYGAPFRAIGELRPGDAIEVVMAQGAVTYRVVNVRRAGDPYSQPLEAGASRLTLATAEGAGPLSSLTPGSVVYVEADAEKGFIPPPGLPRAVPDPELVMHGDPGALPLLVLHMAGLLALTLGVVAARQRWSSASVWVIATPICLAFAWATTDVVMRLLPNVI